jgi:hypothetical protein
MENFGEIFLKIIFLSASISLEFGWNRPKIGPQRKFIFLLRFFIFLNLEIMQKIEMKDLVNLCQARGFVYQ